MANTGLLDRLLCAAANVNPYSRAMRKIIYLLDEIPSSFENVAVDPPYDTVVHGPHDIVIKEYRYGRSSWFVYVGGDELEMTPADKHGFLKAISRWQRWEAAPRRHECRKMDDAKMRRIEKHLGYR